MFTQDKKDQSNKEAYNEYLWYISGTVFFNNIWKILTTTMKMNLKQHLHPWHVKNLMTTENRWSLGTVEVGTVHVQWIPIYSRFQNK